MDSKVEIVPMTRTSVTRVRVTLIATVSTHRAHSDVTAMKDIPKPTPPRARVCNCYFAMTTRMILMMMMMIRSIVITVVTVIKVTVITIMNIMAIMIVDIVEVVAMKAITILFPVVMIIYFASLFKRSVFIVKMYLFYLRA